MLPAAPFLWCAFTLLALLFCMWAWRKLAEVYRRHGIWMLAMFAVSLVAMAIKPPSPTFSFDTYLQNDGSYATNDLVHISFVQVAQGIDLTSSPVLVFAREISAENAGEWMELTPRRMFTEFPADYVLADATNYNYAVYVDYVPPPTVHTNGVWQMRGIELPDGSFAFPNTSIRKED